MRRSIKRWLVPLAVALLLPACSTIEYYAQAVRGHLEVMNRARSIDETLSEPRTPEALRRRLTAVLKIREFASRELGLPDNGSYRQYADIGRPFVVWNVFAAPEFSLEPVKSCFPVAGCVDYRGYYALADAEAASAAFAARGYDIFVGGVPAYSTLGFFDDPVLNTFVYYPEAELARLLFHELAHHVAYAKDDSVFNESFAVAVERVGLERWLARNGSAEERRIYEAFAARRREFIALVLGYRERLRATYAAPTTPAEKRLAKATLLGQMREDYLGLKERWGGYAGFDRWFAKGVNNANLASVAAYTQLVPAFEALLSREGGDLPRFYAAVRRLAKEPKPKRDAELAALPARLGAAAQESGSITLSR
jgi:predicted aminopeptidase